MRILSSDERVPAAGRKGPFRLAPAHQATSSDNAGDARVEQNPAYLDRGRNRSRIYSDKTDEQESLLSNLAGSEVV
jgi:hypothetical protein